MRKVVWTVPDFTVERYCDRLRELHERITRDGVFRSTMPRTLLECRKPAVVTPRRLGRGDWSER